MKFNDYFNKIPYRETERCILRAFVRDDMNHYFDILRDEFVQQYLGGGVPLFDNEPHITNWLNNINGRLLEAKKVFTWCVEDKKSGETIGRIDLGGFQKKTFAEISYHFAREYWGKGIATEVVNEITCFGRDELKLHRIQGIVRVRNLSSIAVLKKNGYKEEGILRRYPFGREFHDVVMLAIVDEDNLLENSFQ